MGTPARVIRDYAIRFRSQKQANMFLIVLSEATVQSRSFRTASVMRICRGVVA
jgi:hypothetical protein